MYMYRAIQTCTMYTQARHTHAHRACCMYMYIMKHASLHGKGHPKQFMCDIYRRDPYIYTITQLC